MTNGNLWACPRGCDAIMEFIGIINGFDASMCCELYECPSCGEQVARNCFTCIDDGDPEPDYDQWREDDEGEKP
jgi:hypothetical protein